MVKLVFCCRRKSGMTLEAFQHRWLEVHGPLVKKLHKKLPKMTRYVQSHTIAGAASDALQASRGTKPAYDGITEVWFDSIDSMGGDSEEAMQASIALYQDEAEFIDFENSSVFLTEEHQIF